MQTHETDGLSDSRSWANTYYRRRTAVLSAEDAMESNLGYVEHLVLAHPFVAVKLGEIALTGVAQDRHDHCIRIVELARDVERYRRDESGRSADEQALLARQPSSHREGLLVTHRVVLVDYAHIERAWKLVLTDSFD